MLVFINMPTSYNLQERRYCPTAPIHLARSTGYRPGRCMDNECYVRFSVTYPFYHTNPVETTIALLVPLDRIALVNVFFILSVFYLCRFYAIIFLDHYERFIHLSIPKFSGS